MTFTMPSCMHRLTHRFLLTAAAALPLLLTGCGGSGGGFSIQPSGSGKFTTASLKGQYAFAMSGKQSCNGISSFFTRAGSITADGLGNITGGVEDVNVCTGVFELPFLGGSYQVNADGRGLLSLTNATGTTTYSFTLSSSSRGTIIQTNTTSTASGSLRLQDSTAFSLTKIANGYVFDVSGISAALNPLSVIGRFTADGAGNVQNGLYDSNEAGTLSGQLSFSATPDYSLDSTFGSSGRGLATLAGRKFVFYIVDATRILLLGTDFPSALLGEASAQQNLSYTAASLNGSYAFQVGGATATGAIVSAGRFTSDGAGNLNTIILDENNHGTATPLPSAASTISGSYTVDANALGGGTLTWTDTVAGTFTYIFYLASPTQAVFQETDAGITSDGLFLAQNAAAVTPATMAGNFGFVWTGVTSDAVDACGQYALSSTASANASGLMDFNAYPAGVPYFSVPVSGALTLGANPAGRNTFTLSSHSGSFPASTFLFSGYLVDSNTVLLVGKDSSRVLLGTTQRQP